MSCFFGVVRDCIEEVIFTSYFIILLGVNVFLEDFLGILYECYFISSMNSFENSSSIKISIKVLFKSSPNGYIITNRIIFSKSFSAVINVTVIVLS